MSTKTQNNALESAELGAKVDAIVQIVQEMAQEKPTSVNAYGLSTWTKAKKLITDLVKSYSAPVAAQPDLTQQTLDDVMAGIPARDAEIEALRKQVETLQAQLVDRSPEMQGTPVDESPNLQSQQKPVSGADGFDAWIKREYPWLGPIGNGVVIAKEAWSAALAQQDADKVDAEPDMFWDDNDPERCQDSIHNVLVEVQCNRDLSVGDVVEVQRAIRLPNASVRITAVENEDGSGDLEYEVIDAARKEPDQ